MYRVDRDVPTNWDHMAGWHQRRKGDHYQGVEPIECWHCTRAVAICRHKIRYNTREEAEEAARDWRQRTEYQELVVRYPCRFVGDQHYHLTSKLGSHRRKSTERERRKWLWKRVLSGV